MFENDNNDRKETAGRPSHGKKRRIGSVLSVMLIVALLSQNLGYLQSSLAAWTEAAGGGVFRTAAVRASGSDALEADIVPLANDLEGSLYAYEAEFCLNDGDIAIRGNQVEQEIEVVDEPENKIVITATISNAVKITGYGNGATTDHTITVESGSPIIILQDVYHEGAQCLNLSGEADVTLVVEGNNEITGTSGTAAAIRVSPRSRLTLAGDGYLTVTTGRSAGGAAIGGNNRESNGPIRIESGHIQVYHSGGGAGIGSGGDSGYGDITILGGSVAVESGGINSGAGIGSGNSGYIQNSGTIAIHGGKVRATEGWGGTNIGSNNKTHGTVEIHGGEVYISPGMQTPGIRAERMVITGGAVELLSQSRNTNSAIQVNQFKMDGGSLTGVSQSRVIQAEESLVISGGSLAVRGYSYLGWHPGILTAPQVNIEGGVVSLTAEGDNSASIRGEQISISGGAVSATGTGTSAAIGYWDATYPTGAIVITGGNIEAQGGPSSVNAIGGVSNTGTEIYPTNGTVRVYETGVEADWIGESSSVLIDEREYFLEAHQGSLDYTLYLPAGMHVVETASDRHTVYTNPDSSILGTVPLSIVDGTNGKALTNARLTLRDSSGAIVYQGIAPGYLYLPEGTYQAVISCSGYHTRQREIIIIQGENDEVLIPLNGSNTLGAHIVVTQMTLEDMKAAGIDPDAVGNQQLFIFEVTLEFVARNPVEFSYIGTGEGSPWNLTGPIIIPARGGGSNESEIHIYPISEKFYLVLHGTTKWTKEMFDAELIVVNNSLYETMEDCSASLDTLPEGLSLAEMTGGEQSLEAELGTIAPGGTKSIHWYLRGDEPGNYQISGRVSAEMSGGDVLEAEFQTYEPIKVLAGNAMHLYITVEDKTWENDIYNVIFELKNVSDWPVYNLSLKLDQEQQYRVTKKNGTETTKEYLDEELENYVETESLLPGESLVLEFSTIIKFESEQVADPEYVLVGMWLEMLAGSTTSIPYTFRLVSGVREISRWLSLLEFFTLKECLSEDPVNVLTGDFLWSYTDLFLSGRHDLSYNRYYTSTQTSYGRLGKGWSDNYDYHLYDRGEVVIISLPAGGQTHFLKDGTGYTPIEGSAWQLETDGAGYLLTMHDQSRYHFDEDGNLTLVEIPGGNMLDFSYDGAGRLATVSNASGALEFYYREDGRVEAVEDSAGRQVLFSYTDTGKLEQAENPDGDSLAYGYDDYGRLCEITDFNGNLYLTNEYDTSNRVTRQYVEGMGEFTYSYHEATRTNHYTRSDGSKVTIVYDDQNRIIRETDEDGTRTYTYNSSSQRTKETDRSGTTTTYTYDEAGNVTRIGYGDGSQEQFAYNAQNRMTEWTDAEGSTTFYTYNAAGNLTGVTDARGYVTAYGYDGDENLTEVLLPDGSQLHFTYDEKGNCTQATDGLGNCTTYTYDEAGRVTSQSDPEGNTVTYTYSTAGKLETVTDGLGNQTSYTVNGNGYRTGIRDANGNQTSYTYNTQNQLTGLRDGAGNQIRIDYDELGNRSAVTDGNGNTVSYTCDHVGRVTAFTDANGNTTYYDYDANGNQTRIINALGDNIAWEYDSRNRLVSLTDELGHTTRYTYDNKNQLTALTDALGATTRFTYDGTGNVTAVNDVNGGQTTYEYDARNRVVATTDQTGARSIYTYDAAGNLTAITDGAGNTTAYGYDTLNRVVSRTDGNGNTRTTAYDEGGRIISTIDEKGAETRYGYDNAGNITSRTDALGWTTRYAYDGADRLVKVTAPDGTVTTYEYDGADHLTAVRYADGTSTGYRYDGNGNLTAETDPNGTTTAYAYDVMNRLVGITYADGGNKTYGYDAAGNLVRSTDENGSITRYTYNATNRMISHTDALGGETRFEYDALGNLTRLIQMRTGGGTSQSVVTAYEYDQAGRLIKETDALGNQTGYWYDEAGQVTGRKDADGGDTGYHYDGAGNLIGITYSDGRSVSYQYNPANELTGYTDWLGTTSYELDLLGQIVAVNDSNGYQVSYRYDAQGNQTGITYLDGSQAVYQYDNVNQLTGITAPGAQITYAYDAGGNLTGIRKADGSQETRSYDSRNRLTQVDVDGRNQAVYTYDGAGNLLVSHEIFGETETHASYVYDPLNRLITDVSYGEERTQTDYAYDSLGNLIKETQKTAGIKTETAYAYNNLNQLIQRGSTAYEYDRRGNLIRVKENGVVTASYTYDSTNQMTSGTKGGETSSYIYDGIGRLVRRGNAAGETTYVTDQTMWVDLPLSSLKGNKTANHVYGAEGTAVIGYEGMTYTVTSDRLGSIRRITSPEGTEIAGFTYDAWGRPEKTVAEGYEASALGVANYTGHLYDEALELYYAKARIYSPEIGRFLSEDPIRDGLNWYVYANNNPILFIDTSGYAAYVFYDNNVFGNDTGGRYADAIEKSLGDIYNVDIISDSVMNVSDFIAKWNAMDDSSEIEAVVLLYHGSANTLQLENKTSERLYDGGSDGRFHELNDKSINSLIILGCNTAGNPTRSDSPYNIATSFSNINGIRVVLGSDGSVNHKYNVFTKKYTVESITSEHWKDYKDPGSTTNRGFIVFANGREVETLNLKKYSISDLITSVDHVLVKKMWNFLPYA